MRKILTIFLFSFFVFKPAQAESWSWYIDYISGDSYPLKISYYNSQPHSVRVNSITIKTSSGTVLRTYNLSRVVKSNEEVQITKYIPFGSFKPDDAKKATLSVDYNYGKPRKIKPLNIKPKKESGFKWWYLIFLIPVAGVVMSFFEEEEKKKKSKTQTTPKENKTTTEPKKEETGPKMTGTAFFIDKKGHLITNFHVVSGSGSRLKVVHEGQEIKARIIAKDESLDLALLKASIKNKTFIEISDKILKKMQSIVAAGYPALHLSDDLKLTSGIISSLKGIGNNSALIQIDAALNPGNSGGPIIDKDKGHLAAVAVARMEGSHYQSINYGIKASRVKEFIESNSILLPQTTSKSKKIKKKDIGEILENSTVLIYH